MVNNKKNRVLNFVAVVLLPLVTAIGQTDQSVLKPEKLRQLPDDFKKAYSGKEYDYVVQVSFLDKLKAWFIDLLSRMFNVGDTKAYETLTYLKYLLFFLVIGAAIYYIVKLILNKEGRWLFSRKSQELTEVDLDEVQHIAEADFKKLITTAENDGNYRLAIKYQYLFLLKKMDTSAVISFDSQKTSHDYLLHLEGTAYYTNFSKCAYYYTYIWYGAFEIDTTTYHKAATSFVTLQNQCTND